MSHPQIMSAGLFERDGRVLTVHRRKQPLAGQWLLPLTLVSPSETAEDAVKRHVREQFGVDVASEAFADTVYIDDPSDKQQYVANVFRAQFADGALRFRGDGDYDDARWLDASELALVWMPPTLRDSAVRILSDPRESPDLDWTDASAVAAVASAAEAVAGPPPQGVPLAERTASEIPDVTSLGADDGSSVGAGLALPATDATASVEDAPDNRTGWNTISKSYQEHRYGDRDAGRLKWSWGLYEDEMHLLPDVRGLRALVLGCGGGQDVVALERMGARAVGIDLSHEQIEYAKKYALRHGAENASFVEGTVEDLSRFDDESFDVALSIHAIAYAPDLDRAFTEAARVLRPGSMIALSVPHPLNQVLADEAPYAPVRSYWEESLDWTWEFEDGASARLRERTPTISRWLDMLSGAGFAIERVLEPYQGDIHDESARIDRARVQLVPYVLILIARKR